MLNLRYRVNEINGVSSIPDQVVHRQLVPLLDVIDFDLAEGDRGIAMAIDTVLHLPKLLHLLLAELVSHKVQKSELADAVQNRVDHLCVHRRGQKKHQWCHFLLFGLNLDVLLLTLNVPDSLLNLPRFFILQYLDRDGPLTRVFHP